MKHLLMLCILLIVAYGSIAQFSVLSVGGSAFDTVGGNISYSVGQVVYCTYTGDIGSVAQGVQQPYEISVINGFLETAINLSVSVYPNPATEYLILQFDGYDITGLSYQMYDLQGKRFASKNITVKSTRIAINTLLSATYIIKVTKGNLVLKTFKIVKN